MNQLRDSRGATASAIGETRQYVAFLLDEELYGIDIAFVHTVIVPMPITAVPRTPAYVKGVISLRGQIVPVIDLRTRFGLPARELDSRSRIVILNIGGVAAGLIVDAVTEVVRLEERFVEPPSEILCTAASACISAIGKYLHPSTDGTSEEESLVLLLDADKVLASLEGAGVVAA